MTLNASSHDRVLLPGLTAEGARDLTDQIRSDLDGSFQLIKAAYQGRAWEVLGYSSWNDYVVGEFGNLYLRPPLEKRHEVAPSLRESRVSMRSIASAIQLGRSSVARAPKQPGVPKGTPPEPSSIQGQDGKYSRVTRTTKSTNDSNNESSNADTLPSPLPEQVSEDDVLDTPASVAGVEPLDLAERARKGRERVSRMLREFHGSGSAALPMTIKLASQVAGLVSPLTGESEVPAERLHDLAYDVSRGLRTLVHVAVALRESVEPGESEAAIKSNLRESRDELEQVLRHLEDQK